ncbi:hypothetical protein [Paenibacillus durus]|uniref:hypothetical protein n=1 Tax=Paenibacillus durus TaxID=44251 RepID=UPI00130DEE81|nr:hypothetical protein [Paenibacillus durus]
MKVLAGEISEAATVARAPYRDRKTRAATPSRTTIPATATPMAKVMARQAKRGTDRNRRFGSG